MKIIEGFKLRKFGKENIVIGESAKLVNFNKMIVLNSTAAFLWENICGKEFSTEDITALLVNNYEVDLDTATRDAATIVSDWRDAGLIED